MNKIEWYRELELTCKWCYVSFNGVLYWVYLDSVQSCGAKTKNHVKLITMEEAKTLNDFRILKYFVLMNSSNLYQELMK